LNILNSNEESPKKGGKAGAMDKFSRECCGIREEIARPPCKTTQDEGNAD